MEGKRVAVDKPAEEGDKRVEPLVEPKAAERRAALEERAILGSGTTQPDAIRPILPARVNKDSLATMIDSNSFSNRQ